MPTIIAPSRRAYLPDVVPESIRTAITPALRRPRDLPPQTVNVIVIDEQGHEVETAVGFRQARECYVPDAVDGRLLGGNPISYNGGTYRASTLRQRGFCACQQCGNIQPLSDIISTATTDAARTLCIDCAGIGMPYMQPKSRPHGGWRPVGTGDVHFGLELELEFPRDPNQTASRMLARMPCDLPFVRTDDCSLSNGVELNSHPMSLSYIDEMNPKMIAFIEALKARGARATNADGKPTAAIHIHVSRSAFGDVRNEMLNMWLFAHRADIMVFGHRSEGNMEHWSDLVDNVARWKDRRMYLNERDQTVEARGFQSSVLLNDPSALPKLCRWLLALAKASKCTDANEYMYRSPAELMVWAGFEPYDLPNVPRIDRSLYELRLKQAEWRAAMREWRKRILLKHIRLTDGARPWLRANVGSLTTERIMTCAQRDEVIVLRAYENGAVRIAYPHEHNNVNNSQDYQTVEMEHAIGFTMLGSEAAPQEPTTCA